MQYALVSVILISLLLPLETRAEQDTDKDGLYDHYELFFKTDPASTDTDNDGYSDFAEITTKHDPLQGNGALLKETDTDGDKLWDYEEVIWNTDPENPDTDSDGFKDKIELITGFNPKGAGKLEKWIRIYLSKQRLSYGIGPRIFDTFPTSTGRSGFKTPTGTFAINNKVPLAWSKTYGLWMPYWMSFIGSAYGIHELPYWPGGYREGAKSLGKPVSHGCVRLGIGPAKRVYDFAEVGTRVMVEN